jgi:hypothetical protein
VFGGPFDCPQPEQVIDSLAKENKAASLYKEFVLQTVLLDKTKAGFEGKVELVAQKPILFEGDPGYKAGTQDNYYNDFLFPGLKLLDANDRIITTRGFRSLIHQESISLSQVDLYGDGRPVFEVCIKFGPGSGIRSESLFIEVTGNSFKEIPGGNTFFSVSDNSMWKLWPAPGGKGMDFLLVQPDYTLIRVSFDGNKWIKMEKKQPYSLKLKNGKKFPDITLFP